jgi:hypothetical protein
VKSRATITIPFDQRVLLVRALDCTNFSIWLSEVAQSFDPVSGIQFLISIQTSPKWCPLGAV